MEEIHYNKFFIFQRKYVVRLNDFEDTIKLQDKGKNVPDLSKNHRDYYFFIGFSEQDYSFDNGKKNNRQILDLVTGGKYIFHFHKSGLKKAIVHCQRKPLVLTKNVIIIFERITKNYLKIWRIKNV